MRYVGCLFFLINHAANLSLDQVVSDKQMVKHLQDVVARLEAERRTPEPSMHSEALLKEKELKIKEVRIMNVKSEISCF